MSTPFASLEMPNGHESQPFADPAVAANTAEEEALIEESVGQVRSLHQAPATMSPRIPRKRIVPNNVNPNFAIKTINERC